MMLFLKYISDLWNDHLETYRKQYGDDESRIRRRLERERFILPRGASFQDLYSQRNEANIGELINIALEKIEDSPTAPSWRASFGTSTSTPRPISAVRRTATVD